MEYGEGRGHADAELGGQTTRFGRGGRQSLPTRSHCRLLWRWELRQKIRFLEHRASRSHLSEIDVVCGGHAGSHRRLTPKGFRAVRELYLYGSAASRSPSPKKLKASTTTNTGTTGSISQG